MANVSYRFQLIMQLAHQSSRFNIYGVLFFVCSFLITGNETKEPGLIKELKDSKFMNGYYRGHKKNVRSWKRNALK